MWSKLALAVLVGVIIGIAVTIVTIYLLSRGPIRNSYAQYLPQQWSSADKEWPAFADWLRHGGRKELSRAAFSAAEDGMSEAEIRATFGPPDLVVVGDEEFRPHEVAHMVGAGGAYFYKLGRFASPVLNKLVSEAFVIVFDRDGRVMYRLGFGMDDGDGLADVDADTRSDRRIAPP